jgi:hypothetical protein
MSNIASTTYSPVERRQVLKSASALLACSVFGSATSKAWEQSDSSGRRDTPSWRTEAFCHLTHGAFSNIRKAQGAHQSHEEGIWEVDIESGIR